MINYNNPPEKVEIYFSKNKTLIQAFWSVSGLIGSTYLFLVYEVKLLLIPIVVSLIALVFDLRKIFRKAPVIIISKNGILFKNDFLDWKNVTKYEIIEEQHIEILKKTIQKFFSPTIRLMYKLHQYGQ